MERFVSQLYCCKNMIRLLALLLSGWLLVCLLSSCLFVCCHRWCGLLVGRFNGSLSSCGLLVGWFGGSLISLMIRFSMEVLEWSRRASRSPTILCLPHTASLRHVASCPTHVFCVVNTSCFRLTWTPHAHIVPSSISAAISSRPV